MPISALNNLSKFAVAVSGGSDSMALAYLISQTPRLRDKAIAYTVDHGVRNESGSEAQKVHEIVSDLGISHRVLKLEPLHSTRELTMRQARYSKLIHAMSHDRISTIVTAHTQDDCIETFVVRMLRGSGLFGLAGIQPGITFNPYTWGGKNVSLVRHPDGQEGWRLLRPLLETRKQDLRQVLIDNQIPWFEDPTNIDVSVAERNLVRKMYCEYPEMIPHVFQPENVLRLLEKLNRYRAKCENEASEVSQVILHETQQPDGRIILHCRHLKQLEILSPDVLQLVVRDILSPLSPLPDLSLRLHRFRDLVGRLNRYTKFNIVGVDFEPSGSGNACIWELSREVPRRPLDHIVSLSPGHVSLWDNRFFLTTDMQGATAQFVDWSKHRHLFTTKKQIEAAREQAKRRNPIVVSDDGNYTFPVIEGTLLNGMPK